jgi:NitT/TauT family transport system permease protein
MALILFQSDRMLARLRAPARVGSEFLVLAAVAGVIGAVMVLARQWSQPLAQTVEISLSYRTLPLYTLLSLMRGVAAYILSLVFTLVYAPAAASSPRAERVMLPVLDILQSIPVLSFLPTLVLALVGLFPTRELGLELACVLMIFTAQAWNMTFSFHGSLKAIPSGLREVAAVNGFSRWQTFKWLEIPASMIGLVWNSMMSMAGGWFFLSVNEAFTLKDKDFRLPGLGSYMAEALKEFDPQILRSYGPVVAGIVALLVMIVVVDQLFWRPIVVWCQRFKFEEVSAGVPQSWVLSLFDKSKIVDLLTRIFRRQRDRVFGAATARRATAVVSSTAGGRYTLVAAKWGLIVGLVAIAAWGLWELILLMLQLPIHGGGETGDWKMVGLSLLASFARTSASLVIGAAWCLPAGILIGRSPKWSRRLQPFVQIAASFPAPVLFPLVTIALLYLKVPFTAGCVALMLLGSQWYILFNVIAGASAIPSDLNEAAAVYRMTAAQRWTKLYVPCVFPYLVVGLLTAAGGAWNATIVSEFVQVKGSTLVAFGVGSVISKATNDGNFPLLTGATVGLAFFVVLFNRLFWKRLYRMVESRYTLQT